jgi:hypothetical protein
MKSLKFVLISSVSLLCACKGFSIPEEKQPLIDELRYDVKRTLVYDPPQKEYRAQFLGVRCFENFDTNKFVDHDFFFDDANPATPDQLVLSITDNWGLNPGDSFDYVLQQLPLKGSRTLQSWNVRLDNKSTTEKRFRYKFVIDLAGTDGLKWLIDTPVAGTYEFGSTTRDTVVSLEFIVGNKVRAASFCSYKE